MDLHRSNKAPTSVSTPAQMLVDLDIAEEHACIERLQAQIREHEERIRELKSKRNANSEIAKLHPEILQQIFHHVQDSFLKDDFGIRREDRSRSAYRWHHVARVCRYWRALALDTATLWTTISNDRRLWAELSLQRSGEAPLDVVLDQGEWDHHEFSISQPILQHITRIRGLVIYATKCRTGDSIWRELQALCHSPHGGPSILERLHIEFYTPSTLPSQHDNAYKLSAQWFTTTPQLQHLKFEGVDFNWNDIPFHKIRTLHVRTSADSSSRVTVDQLLEFLRQMLMAEELSLSHVLSPAITLPTAPRPRGMLPSLKKLTITAASSSSVARLLSCIAFTAPLNLLNIYVTSESDGTAIQDTTGHAELFQALSGIPQQSLTRLDIWRFYDTYRPVNTKVISLAMYSTEQLWNATYSRPFRVYIDTNGIDAQAHKVIINFCAIADFSYLQHLCVDKLPTESFASIFGVLPHLTSIYTVHSIAFDNLVEALTIPIDQPLGDPLSFPALTTITASKFNINDRLDNPQPFPYAWQLLEVCLMQRCEYGAPIQNLFFDSLTYEMSGSGRGQLQRLKEIVPNVSLKYNLYP